MEEPRRKLSLRNKSHYQTIIAPSSLFNNSIQKMKKFTLVTLCVALLSSLVTKAQVGIGTVSPDASAALDVKSTNLGFLPPRIALASATDVATIASPATGLLVYNTGTAGTSPNIVTPGYYFFNGSKWVPINNTYSPGQVIKITMLPYTSIGQSTSTTMSSGSFATLASYNYTPASSSSTIIVEYNTPYTDNGYGADLWSSEILVNSTQVSYNQQNWVSNSGGGGGTRSGTLFPLMGAYTNSGTTALPILVELQKTSSDDSFTFSGNTGTWLKITEIAR
jgi:hypothetical protein